MDLPPEDAVEARIEPFVNEEVHELGDWLWLWEGDHTFPVVTHRQGLLGRISLAFKRVFRRRVRASTADLWDRQRIFNKALIKHLEQIYAGIAKVETSFDDLGADLQTVQAEILADLRAVQKDLVANQVRLREHLEERVEPLEEFKRRGMGELMRHTDALFSRLDQKLDRSRRLLAELRERVE